MPTDETIPHGELIVCITPEAVAKVTPGGEVSESGELSDLLGDTTRLQPLFSESQSRLRQQAAELRPRFGPAIPDLSRYGAELFGPDSPFGAGEVLPVPGMVGSSSPTAPGGRRVVGRPGF